MSRGLWSVADRQETIDRDRQGLSALHVRSPYVVVTVPSAFVVSCPNPAQRPLKRSAMQAIVCRESTLAARASVDVVHSPPHLSIHMAL
jgi:hypothetical protein